MSNDLMLDVGQANELKLAFRRKHWTNDEIKRLSEGNLLAGVKAVLNGTAKIKPVSEDSTRFIVINETTIAVNLGANPKIPFLIFKEVEVVYHNGEGWVIVEKRADGLYIGGRKVILHLSKRQKSGKSLNGHELREELTGKPVLNANVLDALCENQWLIPEDWKNVRRIYFWGTIYRDSRSYLFVSYLYFSDEVASWQRPCDQLDFNCCYRSDPAALLAS